MGRRVSRQQEDTIVNPKRSAPIVKSRILRNRWKIVRALCIAVRVAVGIRARQRNPAESNVRRSNDLLLIESFFARALDLSLATRAEIAARVARQMAAKMNVAVPPGNPERFLEAIAYAMRSSARSRR